MGRQSRGRKLWSIFINDEDRRRLERIKARHRLPSLSDAARFAWAIADRGDISKEEVLAAIRATEAFLSGGSPEDPTGVQSRKVKQARKIKQEKVGKPRKASKGERDADE